jgi:hypothetical protein
LTCDYGVDNIDAMIPSVHEPNEVLEYLAEPIRHYRDGLDHGVSMADGMMASQRPCPHTWAAVARFGARNYIHDVLDEAGEVEWQLRELPNCGLELVQAPYVLRGLKAQDSGPPSPGRNPSRRRFWDQFQTMTLFDSEAPHEGANLIVDWTLGRERNVLLALSKTRGTWAYKGAPQLEWRLPVVFDAGDEATFVSAEEDVDVGIKFDETEFEMGAEGA